MSDTKLSEHRFNKGKFISPWNDNGMLSCGVPKETKVVMIEIHKILNF